MIPRLPVRTVKNAHLWLDAAAAEDVSAVDDNGLIDDLFADEAGELIGHREEPLALRDVKVEILLRFFGIALKQQQSTNKGNH